MLKKEEQKKYHPFKIALYWLATAMMPNIFLFELYNRNRMVGTFFLHHVMILAGILAVVSLFGMTILRLLLKQYEGALLVLLTGWTFFWLFEATNRITPGGRSVLLIAIVILLLIISALSIKFRNSFSEVRIVFNVLAGLLCVFLVMNMTPAIINVQSGNFDGEVQIRRRFNVDQTLPSPNIYFLMMDGMLGFDVMADFWDDEQAELIDELLARGFVINHDAHLVTLSTTYSIPAMFSPDLYDSFLGDTLASASHLMRPQRDEIIHAALHSAGVTLPDFAPYHEFFHAFMQAGYRQITIADLDANVYVPIDIFYRLVGSNQPHDPQPLAVVNYGVNQNHFLHDAVELIELLVLATPLPERFVRTVRAGDLYWETIADHSAAVAQLTATTSRLSDEVQMLTYLLDSFSVEAPRLTFVTSMITHNWRWHEHDAAASQREATIRTDLYPLAHNYAAMVMLTMIDLILAQDPNAVIVLQADHGFHQRDTQEHLLSLGYSLADIIRLHHSTLSAVLIPAVYGGLDAPLDPRNIVRELVNRFVGQNYELLP